MNKNGRLFKFLKSTLFYIIILVIWQILGWLLVDKLHVLKPYMFATPIQVFTRLLELAEKGTLLKAVSTSMLRLFVGYGISIGIAAFIACMLSLSKRFYGDLRSLLSGTQALPNVCWQPFAILWCGISDSAIWLVIILGSTFAIALAFDSGVRNINPIYLKAARTMSCNRIGMFNKVILPASLPSIIGGLRQGWAFAWRALMASEVLNSSIGLGWLMTTGRDNMDISQLMGIMLIILIIGIIFDKYLFGLLEDKILENRGLK